MCILNHLHFIFDCIFLVKFKRIAVQQYYDFRSEHLWGMQGILPEMSGEEESASTLC